MKTKKLQIQILQSQEQEEAFFNVLKTGDFCTWTHHYIFVTTCNFDLPHFRVTVAERTTVYYNLYIHVLSWESSSSSTKALVLDGVLHVCTTSPQQKPKIKKIKMVLMKYDSFLMATSKLEKWKHPRTCCNKDTSRSKQEGLSLLWLTTFSH